MRNNTLHGKGYLNILLDSNFMRMEWEGQNIKMTFSSYQALRKFFLCKKPLENIMEMICPKMHFQNLTLNFYLKDFLIGETNGNIPNTFFGKYMGLKNTKLYFGNFLKYFFS